MIDLTCSQRTVSLTGCMASSLFLDHCALQVNFGIRPGTRETAFIVGCGTKSRKGRAGLGFFFEPRRIIFGRYLRVCSGDIFLSY